MPSDLACGKGGSASGSLIGRMGPEPNALAVRIGANPV